MSRVNSQSEKLTDSGLIIATLFKISESTHFSKDLQAFDRRYLGKKFLDIFDKILREMSSRPNIINKLVDLSTDITISRIIMKKYIIDIIAEEFRSSINENIEDMKNALRNQGFDESQVKILKTFLSSIYMKNVTSLNDRIIMDRNVGDQIDRTIINRDISTCVENISNSLPGESAVKGLKTIVNIYMNNVQELREIGDPNSSKAHLLISELGNNIKLLRNAISELKNRLREIGIDDPLIIQTINRNIKLIEDDVNQTNRMILQPSILNSDVFPPRDIANNSRSHELEEKCSEYSNLMGNLGRTELLAFVRSSDSRTCERALSLFPKPQQEPNPNDIRKLFVAIELSRNPKIFPGMNKTIQILPHRRWERLFEMPLAALECLQKISKGELNVRQIKQQIRKLETSIRNSKGSISSTSQQREQVINAAKEKIQAFRQAIRFLENKQVNETSRGSHLFSKSTQKGFKAINQEISSLIKKIAAEKSKLNDSKTPEHKLQIHERRIERYLSEISQLEQKLNPTRSLPNIREHSAPSVPRKTQSRAR
ncbi:MAG: hypothetical protein LBJ93_02015 [Clostridiales bacterium]|nr:hypothetical protein [Clostridiales bacterium]